MSDFDKGVLWAYLGVIIGVIIANNNKRYYLTKK